MLPMVSHSLAGIVGLIFCCLSSFYINWLIYVISGLGKASWYVTVNVLAVTVNVLVVHNELIKYIYHIVGVFFWTWHDVGDIDIYKSSLAALITEVRPYGLGKQQMGS